MKKGVACAIAEFDETKALVIFKPFNNGFDGRDLPSAAEAGRLQNHRHQMGTEVADFVLGIISKRGVIIKTALTRTPEISTFAHVTCSSPPKPARLYVKLCADDLDRLT